MSVIRSWLIGASLLGLACAPARALAWDSEGHRIIAHLAYERLTPVVRAAVDALISHASEEGTPSCPVGSLEDASTWPDCIRPLHDRFSYLAVMHYEDVPLCGAAPKTSYCPDGKCVTDETRRAIAILKDRHRSTVERLQALEEVAHFIGDIHQPLHAADNNDRGGNEVRVEVEGHESNLHHVWDTEVLENAVGTDETIAAKASTWRAGEVDSWLAESHHIAVTYVYPRLAQPPKCGAPAPAQTISQAYLDDAAPIVRVQLARAAVRLARVLNEALS